MSLALPSSSAEQTREIAKRFALSLTAPACITLTGDLGAGKTCFAQGVIETLCGEQATSPTFALSQQYMIRQGRLAGKTLWHYDLYRLKQAEEAEETGLFEALQDNLVLIEWPEIVAHWLPPNRVEITLRFAQDAAARQIDIRTPESYPLEAFVP